MALTAEDLRDLVALLQAHPEWREPLWALLASEEVRRMPADLKALRAEVDRRFAELAEAQRRTEESLQRLSEAFVAHRQEFLAYREETDRRFAELAEAQRRT
jgi:predicted  nucleic acid-binding Zn-ribbon protein